MVIETVGIVGTGSMGLGIARHVAAHDIPVTLLKWTPGSLDGIARSLGDDDDLVRLTADREAVETCDLIIETIAEDRDAKIECLSSLNERVKPEAIFATNTSTLNVWDLDAAVRLPHRPGLRRGRFIGLHFFNPVKAMRLVEVVALRDTAPEALQASLDFVKRVGKEPVTLQSYPGQLVNNLLMALFVRALDMMNVAGVEAFDKAMELGANHPMGPFKLMDLIGIDVVAAMAKNLGLGGQWLLDRMSEKGWFGRKAGLGFYDYRQDKKNPRVNPELQALLESAWQTA